MNTIVGLYQVSKIFGQGPAQVLANDSVTLEVKDGEKILLTGPSGSGKTTLLLITGCLLKPSCGRVFFKGQEITTFSEERLPQIRLTSVGFVFQSFNLLSSLTAFENVELPARLAGRKGEEAGRQARALLEAIGLKDRLCHLPQALSAGEKQRVALARALVNRPALVLADEPTANLDRQNGEQVIRLLCQGVTPGCGRSIIIASHDPRIIPFVDRILRLEDGRITGERVQASGV